MSNNQSTQPTNKRRTSAGRIHYTSSAGARASLIVTCIIAGGALFGLANTPLAMATSSSLTLSVTDSIALDIIPASANGTFATSSTSDTTISVKTNNYNGYTLGIAASTANNNALTCTGCSTTGTNTTIPSITTRVSATDFANDANKTTYNNTWGYRPSKYNSVDNTTTNYYYPGPKSTMADTLDATSTANATTANTYNIAVGARVDYTKEAGSYENTFVITVVANPTLYSITYNANTTDTVSNMPANIVNGSTDSDIITLATNVPTRSGYEFTGWNTSPDGTGTTYAAGSNWTIDQTAAGSFTLELYAMWAGGTDERYMQDVSRWGDGLELEQEVIAIDRRDGKHYTVAKLADDNIWMTQNLDHDIDSTKTYTPQDTDIPANWTPSLSTYAAGDSTWGGGSYTTPESADPGNLYWPGISYDQESCEAADGWWREDSETGDGTCVDATADSGDPHYHLGNRYNWTAAVAMNDSSSYTTDGTLVDQSICPAGWTLPSAAFDLDIWEPASDNDFNNLWSAYGLNSNSFIDVNNNYKYDTGEDALWTSPLYFNPGGDWYGWLGGVGEYGTFWSPVVGDAYSAYSVLFRTNDGGTAPSSPTVRDFGHSIRCIARPVAGF